MRNWDARAARAHRKCHSNSREKDSCGGRRVAWGRKDWMKLEVSIASCGQLALWKSCLEACWVCSAALSREHFSFLKIILFMCMCVLLACVFVY